MPDFRTTDPRGITVVLTQDRYTHGVEGHFGFLSSTKGLYPTLTTALSHPFLILENPQHQEATLGPQRQPNSERYVSRVSEWNLYVVFAVVKFDSGSYTRPGGPTINAPVRVVWTAHEAETVPSGNIIWQASL